MSLSSIPEVTSFSSKLQNVIRKTKRGNLVYSPLGVTLCSSMAYVGAEGKTKSEMETSLGYPADEENPFPAKLMKLLNENNSKSVTLKTVQKVFIQRGYDILPQYSERLRQLEAGVGLIDHKEAQRSCNEVNTWVRKATKDKIKEIVTKDQLNKKDLSLILINSIYFHGKWETRFPKQNTMPEDFFFENREVAKVPMMTLYKCQNKLQYVNCQKLKAEIVKLPYKGKRFCMLVFIPNTMKDFSSLEKGLLTMSVDDCLKELNGFKKLKNRTILSVTLPKFEFETDLDLKKPLKQLGIEDAFNIHEADFSEISDDSFGLYISNVIQKAMIKVCEEGTLAAAVTVAEMGETRRGSDSEVDIIDVVADHPFYFQIIEQEMQVVLFSGVVLDPREKS